MAHNDCTEPFKLAVNHLTELQDQKRRGLLAGGARVEICARKPAVRCFPHSAQMPGQHRNKQLATIVCFYVRSISLFTYR
jgi:hypothetical protein